MRVDGLVVRLEAGRAHVKVKRSGGCGRCHEVGGCGGVAQDETDAQIFVVDNAFGAQSGQRVWLEVPEGATLKAAALAYGAPLTAILAGAVLGFGLWRTDGAAVLGAMLGLAVALMALYGLRASGFLRTDCPRITGLLQP